MSSPVSMGEALKVFRDIPPGVLDYAQQRGASAYIEKAVVLARSAFRMIKFAGIHLLEDPESGERYIAIDAHVPLPMDEATESYRAFCVEWGKQVPWPQRDLISLVHSVITCLAPATAGAPDGNGPR